MRHTDVEVPNPSTLQQRQDAARRQAFVEVGYDEEVTNVHIGETGTQMGDDSQLWWPVTYGVRPTPRR